MWLSLSSDRLSQLELSDYARRFVQDRLAMVSGVASVRIGGEREYAMRVWLDRQALAAGADRSRRGGGPAPGKR